MSPLRFRVWRTDNDTWYNGEPFSLEETTWWQDWPRGCRFDELIVMQSTGLLDKNGKEIFEGDVYLLYREGGDRRQYVVESLQEFFEDKGWDEQEDCAYYTPENIEVIGNIHENPELLPAIA